MRLVVFSIGRLKQGPERELAERYRQRFDDIGRKLGFRGLEIHEIAESRARDTATRIADEAAAISAASTVEITANGFACCATPASEHQSKPAAHQFLIPFVIVPLVNPQREIGAVDFLRD